MRFVRVVQVIITFLLLKVNFYLIYNIIFEKSQGKYLYAATVRSSDLSMKFKRATAKSRVFSSVFHCFYKNYLHFSEENPA